jgi:flagellar protein FliS
MAQKQAGAYQKVGVETGVSTASPHQLIVLLFDGALASIRAAAIAMDARETAAKGSAISKAIDIIANGLKVSLDRDAGGDLADRLAALYDYMCDRLLFANLRDNRAALDEVGRLLNELADAWKQIGNSESARSA